MEDKAIYGTNENKQRAGKVLTTGTMRRPLNIHCEPPLCNGPASVGASLARYLFQSLAYVAGLA